MSFFGIQVGLLQIALNKNPIIIISYCNFTATRIESIETVEEIDIFTPINGIDDFLGSS
jgi:hypothetical protein